MSPEAQRIAIAEALGWTNIKRHGRGEFSCLAGWHKEHALKYGTGAQGEEWNIPRFLTDLNACHEMEKTLSEEERSEYYVSLGHICCPPNRVVWNVIHATAPQRCEAFLKAKGLWK